MGFQKDSQFNISKAMNDRTYLDYFERLQMLSLSLFKWSNLPETCDARFLELCLFQNGKALFINDPDLGFLNTRVTYSGALNHYELPVRYQAFSVGYSKQFDNDECVLIMNNLLMKPTSETIELFAIRLYEAERTIDTNIKSQKTPVLLTCSNNQQLTLKNLYMKYDGNQPFIFGDKSQDLGDMINVFKTDAPYIADKIEDYKHQLINECLTFLGINNANTDKAERLITDEVNSNNDLVNYNCNNFLKTRKIACEQINKMFNLNVSVDIDKNVQQKIEDLTNNLTNNKDLVNNEKDGGSNE